MVQTQLVKSQGKPALKADLETLFQLARDYADAQRDWSEAFILHKMSDPKMTDALARAKADIDVDLLGARLQYETLVLVAQEHGTMSIAKLEEPDARQP